ncbi:DUF2243 domain-containing protein [Bradyrhizobium retamae]|uniref:DUF2243 domain-containing protein n=1 Tax=Bradyrhizobium retamae TaxID=1300035 RepID=A0A0R3N5Z9_9BRAD|nr:DUF2243 domain-containing protein [Bradyrhizobium retamae]KRR27627.1 hypothetical protein CQ13_04390 [Bradyrhizobium retamae]
MPESARFTKPLHWCGHLLGFSLGGFFDGIMLHQILQWHHLLSALPGELFRDIRLQIFADGLFHGVMYVVAAAGLWLLWRVRQEFSTAGADQILFADVLIGFGAWHILDGILSHWLIGIHRIRMDSSNPLVWDLVWFFAFGIAPLLLGWLLRRYPRSGRSMRGGTAASVTVVTILSAAAVSMLPAPNATQVIVYFMPGTTAQQVFSAAMAADARIIGFDASQTLWAFELADAGQSKNLYRHGALFVSNSMFPASCLSWSRLI